MRLIFLLIIILLTSCANKKDTMVNRQKAIQNEMKQVKAAYYKNADSLEMVKKADTGSAKQYAIAVALVSAESKKNLLLIPLQKEYDSLEAVLRKK